MAKGCGHRNNEAVVEEARIGEGLSVDLILGDTDFVIEGGNRFSIGGGGGGRGGGLVNVVREHCSEIRPCGIGEECEGGSRLSTEQIASACFFRM